MRTQNAKQPGAKFAPGHPGKGLCCGFDMEVGATAPHVANFLRCRRNISFAGETTPCYDPVMDRDVSAHLSENIRQLREGRSLTQLQGAQIAGVLRPTWATLEPGDVVVFRGDQRHSYRNPGRSKAVAYSVVALAPAGR